MVDEPLKFQVAPHIVEDLGLNLYTSLPRVLAEFVANAHDADSEYADIQLDFDAIKAARKEISDQFKRESGLAKETETTIAPLGSRLLPAKLTIVVEDAGHGMRREDLRTKFLIAGRRRRQEAGTTKALTEEKRRPLMGRKGLGKLAGFGVAKRVDVVTQASGESHATKVSLDYDELIKSREVLDVAIPEERLEDGGGFPAGRGTRVTLSCLLHDPVKSRPDTIARELAEHFEFVDPEDFEIRINGQPVEPLKRDHSFAWPKPERNINELIQHALDTDEGPVSFSYRLRFTSDRNALPAEKRGVRVYSSHRLAAMPSLLDADTNMHGFRMTDYLDGVVNAPFIDLRETDYIATDRQSLRWDAPLLSPLKEFLSVQIKEACKQYQHFRDERIKTTVREDIFTREAIGRHTDFSHRERRLANRIASAIASSSKRGVDDPSYKDTLPLLLDGLGHGKLLNAITRLSQEDHPNLDRLTVEVAKLTRDEFEQFVARVRTRIKAIETLKKIVEAAHFKASQNEKEIQLLFEGAPWLVDPTYTQFLTANQRASTLFTRLAEHLKIGGAAPAEPRRPEAARPRLPCGQRSAPAPRDRRT